MLRKINTLITRIRLFRLRNDPGESLWLRRHFRDVHDIDVGLHSYGCFDRWRMPGPLTIGRYCSFARTVRVVDANHPLEALTTHPLLYESRFGVVDRNQIHAERLIIEDDVWVGNNVVILPGCKFVGRGAVIGAGSIVTKNVNRYAIVAGVPAVPLRMRFPPELCAAIEETNWWLLEPGQIKALLQSYPDLVRYPSVNYIAEATAQGFAWPALTKIRSNR